MKLKTIRSTCIATHLGPELGGGGAREEAEHYQPVIVGCQPLQVSLPDAVCGN